MTWISDAHGNRCSVEMWGSEEAARTALNSLLNCWRCSNCSRCSGCKDCWNCSNCSGCEDCSGCSNCSRCSNCLDCSGCSDCSRCLYLVNAAPVQAGEAAEPIIVPKIPDIHKAVYAAASNPDALRMETWHTCEKKHCRAGWVVALAGVEGKKLEARFGTLLAAMNIYDASDPTFKINPCRFYDSNEDALADMKRLAEGGSK
jgi:hypothetical protein